MAHLINYRGKLTDNVVVDDDELPSIILPSINIINHILTMCIESNKRSRIAYLILVKYRYENKCWLLMDVVQSNHDFLTILMRGLVLSNFARLSSMDIPASDTKAMDLPFDIHTINFYNLMLACMNRRTFRNVNMIAEMHHQLWYLKLFQYFSISFNFS